MKCPKCGTRTITLQKLATSENEVYRKHVCPECEHIFYTTEFEIEKTAAFKKEWRELQEAEVKEQLTKVTDHYGYRCEYHRKSNQFIYVVYHIEEATMADGQIDKRLARGYFGTNNSGSALRIILLYCFK